MRLSRGASIDELERVYRADFARFVRVATAISGDEESGADAVHDAFVQAVRSRRSYRREGPLEAWVWRMVVNAARKSLRRPAPAELEAPVAGENGTGDPVRAAVAALPERQRLTLFLRYYADLDYDAITATLGVAPGTVGATLNAAHAALRNALKEADQWT
jgi:DNA-directed RNA polymerase specialized sigma24 family protein